NGWRAVRLHVLQIGLGSQSSGDSIFVGSDTSATFPTRCLDGAGWWRDCRLNLMIEERRISDDRIHAVLRVYEGGHRGFEIPLKDGARLGYLMDARQGGAWVSQWSASSPPLGIGVLSS